MTLFTQSFLLLAQNDTFSINYLRNEELTKYCPVWSLQKKKSFMEPENEPTIRIPVDKDY